MRFLFLSLMGFAFIGCAQGQKGDENSLGNPVYYAKADIYGLKSKRSMGVVRFSEAFGKVKVDGEIKNLLANHQHGFSIYEFGDCSKTGERYKGMDKDDSRAIGRLGNIVSNGKGRAQIDLDIEGLSINTGKYPIVGRSIVIHQHKDDMVSKGHGGAGMQIACGVIGASSK